MNFLIVITTLIAWAAGQQVAARYPAGVDPRLCPSFPQCDNAILAAFAKHPLFGGRSAGGVGAGANDIKIDHFILTPPGYPVGLTRDQCPNYPFCN